MQLNASEKTYLLREARHAIEAILGIAAPSHEEPQSRELLEPHGAFVTLRTREGKDLKLRGCMGVVAATRPLIEAVRDSAVSAATADPRFPRLTPNELRACTMEISVLSKMIACTPNEVEPGRDGVMITYGPASGLLLPQVAVEQGWDRVTLLDHLCVKAGAQPGCWKDDRATLQRFTATVFAEDEPFD
ncbi:MAG: AmmeMemoRadiSam system protein A [Spirochaetes bacterium]|jgi:AmmeMemoRadiSam system protein A|nr:AmmeMemoRadiSam system protein A [Spirochaetota bacterium]